MSGRSLFASLNESRPDVPAVAPVNPVQARVNRALARERFLAESGYTIVPDGAEKVLKVNRAWVAPQTAAPGAPAPSSAKWLLFIDGNKTPIPCSEVLYLDETTTETEVVNVQEQRQERYGCGTHTVTVNKEVRSAYMISQGRVAYKAAS